MKSTSFTRVLALGMFAAALVLMGLAVIVPFTQASRLDETMAQNREILANLRRQVAREGDLRQEHGELTAAGLDEGLLLKGETMGIAGANLQKIINALVLKHGGTASSLQIMPSEEDGNLMRVPMSLSLLVGVDGLKDLLYGLEAGTPLIFVDSITIRSTQEEFAKPNANYIGPFDVALQLSGYALKTGAAQQ